MFKSLNLTTTLSQSPSRATDGSSPQRNAGGDKYRTPTKKQKNNFPTTPRSVEKHKKIIQNRLRKAMETNLRLAAKNKILKADNKVCLDKAVKAEIKNQNQQALVHKAQNEIVFIDQTIEVKKEYLQKLEDREICQERNLQSLVNYAKKITAELENYNQKVELSERIVQDLRESGNDSVDGLLGMLKRYKRQQKNVKEEIEKLKKLVLVKDNDIVTLNEEINSLNDFRNNQIVQGQATKEGALRMSKENTAVIKRQDKLIVDFQQKNEMCQIVIADTEAAVQRKNQEKSTLQMKLKELEDQRTILGSNVGDMDRRLRAYRTWLVEKKKTDTKERDLIIQQMKKREEEQKATRKRHSPMKSALKENRAQKVKSGSSDGGTFRM